jgi:hypothetical protein
VLSAISKSEYYESKNFLSIYFANGDDENENICLCKESPNKSYEYTQPLFIPTKVFVFTSAFQKTAPLCCAPLFLRPHSAVCQCKCGRRLSPQAHHAAVSADSLLQGAVICHVTELWPRLCLNETCASSPPVGSWPLSLHWLPRSLLRQLWASGRDFCCCSLFLYIYVHIYKFAYVCMYIAGEGPKRPQHRDHPWSIVLSPILNPLLVPHFE